MLGGKRISHRHQRVVSTEPQKSQSIARIRLLVHRLFEDLLDWIGAFKMTLSNFDMPVTSALQTGSRPSALSAQSLSEFLHVYSARSAMASITMANGTSALGSSQSNEMPLTEYTANPSPTATEKLKASSSVPAAFLLPDGYPDVRILGFYVGLSSGLLTRCSICALSSLLESTTSSKRPH